MAGGWLPAAEARFVRLHRPQPSNQVGLVTQPSLRVEPTQSKDLGPCPCCGNVTRRVWGYVHALGATEAAYFVEWVPGGVDHHGANFDLIIGPWGDGARSSDRVAVSLAFRRTPTGPEFMVIDAADREIGRSELVGSAPGRDEVLAGPLATRAFAIVDAVWLQDVRISELIKDAA